MGASNIRVKPEEITHQEMVRLLKKDGEVIRQALQGHECDLMHMAIGVASEGGELLDAVKKAIIYRKPLDRENVVEELGDLEFFMEGVRQNLGISREETLDHNKRKLHKRYEDYQYTDQRAHERADKILAAPARGENCCPQCGRETILHSEAEQSACERKLYGADVVR